jgi:DNA invertase Pin-like site-specific DNA recombinase
VQRETAGGPPPETGAIVRADPKHANPARSTIWPLAARFLLTPLLGAIDEFQRELIVEGTPEGLGAARARGRTGGRKPELNARQAATVRRMYQAAGPDGKQQHTVAEIAEAVGVHRTTVDDYLSKEG